MYRIADEALSNVVRHAEARELLVRLERAGERLALSIVDNGRGFEVRVAPEGHYGLQGMRERAEMVGGVLEVESRPGEGTTVRLRVEAGT